MPRRRAMTALLVAVVIVAVVATVVAVVLVAIHLHVLRDIFPYHSLRYLRSLF